MTITDYFHYDQTSPTRLVWSQYAEETSPGQRPYGCVAGHKTPTGYHVQVLTDGIRTRSTARRVVWELHHGPVPNGFYIATLGTEDIEDLICIDHSTLQYLKAWKAGVTNIHITGSGKWEASLRPFPSLGTYDTEEEASLVYRTALKNILVSRIGRPL